MATVDKVGRKNNNAPVGGINKLRPLNRVVPHRIEVRPKSDAEKGNNLNNEIISSRKIKYIVCEKKRKKMHDRMKRNKYIALTVVVIALITITFLLTTIISTVLLLKNNGICDDTTCGNGGTCLSDGLSCVCLPGYTGSSCQTAVCDDTTCENGGTCYVISDSLSCMCLLGYTGNSCQTVEGGADVVIILDRSGSMSSSVGNNRAYMNAIAQTLTIGQHDMLVSVLFVYQTPSLMWDFGSSYANSSVNLVNAFNSLSSSNSISNEASGSSLGLGPALDYARITLLPGGRATAADVVIMFWDGDYNLTTEAALLHSTARVVSVSPTVRTGNVESIVTSLEDMFYSNTDSSTLFINRLQDIISTCN